MTTNSKLSPRSIQLKNGVELPLVGLGTFKSHGQDLRNTIKKALAVGVRHIDTAAVYKVCYPLLQAAHIAAAQKCRITSLFCLPDY